MKKRPNRRMLRITIMVITIILTRLIARILSLEANEQEPSKTKLFYERLKVTVNDPIPVRMPGETPAHLPAAACAILPKIPGFFRGSQIHTKAGLQRFCDFLRLKNERIY
jgi:hypothetical protein